VGLVLGSGWLGFGASVEGDVRRVKDPAHGIVDEFRLGKGLMAAF
jgi:hypothetical protein